MGRKIVWLVWMVTACSVVTAQDAGSSAGSVAGTPPSSSSEMDDDMRKILQKVGSVPCAESVRSKVYLLLFGNNRELHDQCVNDCGYQFFPASKAKATTQQIIAAATSKACVALFSGVILAKLPECDVDFVSTRSCAEVLLRIKTDIDDKQTPPTQQQFFEFYNLNRVINLLNENSSLIEATFQESSSRISVWEMTKMMNRIYVNPGVRLEANMTIFVRDAENSSTSTEWRPANVAFAANAASVDAATQDSSGATTATMSSQSGSSHVPAAPTPASSAVMKETVSSSGHALSASVLLSVLATFAAITHTA